MALTIIIGQVPELFGIRKGSGDFFQQPFIDVTAARMLVALQDDLEHHEVRLLIARGVGQVRDILRNVVDDPDHFEFFPSVAAAVETVARPEPS